MEDKQFSRLVEIVRNNTLHIMEGLPEEVSLGMKECYPRILDFVEQEGIVADEITIARAFTKAYPTINAEFLKTVVKPHMVNPVNFSRLKSIYENNIKKEQCDIIFKYDKDYSNFEELIGLIENAII